MHAQGQNDVTGRAPAASGPLRAVYLVSRNKDNVDVDGFKQRTRKLLSTASDSELIGLFSEFVSSGVPGERCRLYVTVNARDNEKVSRSLMHWLIDHPERDISCIGSLAASLAACPECAAERKWMFDYDADPELVSDFIADIAKCDPEVEASVHRTPNGYCVIASRGFDTRDLHLGEGKWKDVELKRDGMRCLAWMSAPRDGRDAR